MRDLLRFVLATSPYVIALALVTSAAMLAVVAVDAVKRRRPFWRRLWRWQVGRLVLRCWGCRGPWFKLTRTRLDTGLNLGPFELIWKKPRATPEETKP